MTEDLELQPVAQDEDGYICRIDSEMASLMVGGMCEPQGETTAVRDLAGMSL